MSDNGDSAAAAPKFSERELQLLGFAMQSLKSGPPEIDYDNLARLAGMSNPRSASNAWAKLKNKLMAPTDGSGPAPAVSTPRKKRGAASENGTPKKTPTKRGAKKQEVDDAGEASPKKKGRPAKGAAKVKSEDVIKEEEADDETPSSSNGNANGNGVTTEVKEEEASDESEEV